MDADQRAILDAARAKFPHYYVTAPHEDTAIMDGLVLARVALLIGINSPRPRVNLVLRYHLERTTDATERVFTELREAVRRCPTFVALPEDERRMLEQTVFDLQSAIPA